MPAVTGRSIAHARSRVRQIWSLEPKYRTLHLTWLAFFLTFVVWFNFAPFVNTIGTQFGLSKSEKITIGLCNVALTVPARIFIGMALDRFGPRRVFSAILVYATVPCLAFALADSFSALVLSRLAMSVVGAGFVVGIRMISEWFPPREVGTAEGVYGGWGNFGSAAAAFALPLLAGLAGGANGWRWASVATGGVAGLYGLWYGRSVRDTPAGVTYLRPRRQGALEVTSPAATHGLALLNVPLVAVLGVIAWRVWLVGVLSTGALVAVVAGLVVLLVVLVRQVYRVNHPALAREYPPEDQYPLRTVAVLALAYFCTFGAELAVVTMLPAFFADTWGLSPAVAGAAAAGFAFTNLVSRPAGGMLSDLLGSRRRTLRALLAGLSLGYVGMAALGSAWPVPLAVAVTMVGSFVGQAGSGAVFAIVPVVKKRVSGQVAGMVGAYGNVGAIAFLTLLLFVPTRVFFLVIGTASVLGAAATRWLVEPEDSFGADLVVDLRAAVPASPTAPPLRASAG